MAKIVDAVKKATKKVAEVVTESVEQKIEVATEVVDVEEVTAEETYLESLAKLQEETDIEEVASNELPKTTQDDHVYTDDDEVIEPQVKLKPEPVVKDFVNTDKYIPVVDSFGAGNVVGFVTVSNVGKFVEATRATVGQMQDFGAVACDYKGRMIGVLGSISVLGKQVPAIDCMTGSQQTNMGCFEDFRTVTEELSGHKYTRMMEFSDFE